MEISSWNDGGQPSELDVVGNLVYLADRFEGLEEVVTHVGGLRSASYQLLP